MPPSSHKPLVVAIASGLIFKIILFAFVFSTTGISPVRLMAGHDGGEYIAYAHAMCSSTNAPLAADAVRHDPGLPALLATMFTLTGHLIPMIWLAFLLQITSWAAGVYVFAKFCNLLGISNVPIVIAFAIGYPAALYYGQFNLTEQMFTTLILASLCLNQSNKYALAMLIAGLSAAIRSTGLLLSFSLFASSFLSAQLTPSSHTQFRLPSNPVQKLIIFAILGALPWLAGQLLVTYFLGTNVSTHKPGFGLPFSGFRGFSEIGTKRSIYILAVIGFFIAATILPFWKSKSRSHPQYLTAPALFCAIFLIFHLCLKSLFYIDHTVYTLNFYDRYLLPLWPLALIVFRRWIKWPATSAMAAVSLFLSLWWLHNYIPASGL